MTTREANNYVVTSLEPQYGSGEAQAMAAILMEKITGHRGAALVRAGGEDFPANALRQLEQWLAALSRHEPIQYVLNEAWFMEERFYVDPSVLIPRPETEELVHWIVEERQFRAAGIRAIDIGTGSGCIAISLKKKLAGVTMDAVDASEKALQVARRNAAQLAQEVNFSCLDFLDESVTASLRVYDLIISNPPYIPEAGRQAMPVNVTQHEPSMALFVPDNDPLIFYKAIAQFAQSHLAAEGKIFVEIHEDMGTQTMEVFVTAGFRAILRNDLQGKERMIMAWRNG